MTQRFMVLLVGLSALLVADLVLAGIDPDLPPVSSFPTPESEVKFEQVTSAELHPEVVFLGSSFTEAAVDPDLLRPEIESYNLAMPFTDLETMEVWLREVVLPADPDLVVLTFPVWGDMGSGTDGVSEALARSITADQRRTGRSWLVEHAGSLSVMDRSLARQRLLAADLWTDSGHQTGYADKVGDSDTWAPRGREKLDAAEASRLLELIELAQAHGSEVVVIIEAVAPAIAPPEEHVLELIADIDALVAPLSVPVWSTPAGVLDDRMFVDGVHLNRDGTTVYSEFVKRMTLALRP